MTQEERGNEYRMNLSGPLLHARSEMETRDLDRTTLRLFCFERLARDPI